MIITDGSKWSCSPEGRVGVGFFFDPPTKKKQQPPFLLDLVFGKKRKKKKKKELWCLFWSQMTSILAKNVGTHKNIATQHRVSGRTARV